MRVQALNLNIRYIAMLTTASLQLFAAIVPMIAKLSIQPNAASAMAAAKNTKKPRISGMRGRSANVWCYTKEAIISTKVDAEYKIWLQQNISAEY